MERHEKSRKQQENVAVILGQENQLGRDKFYELYWSALKKRDELKKLEEKEIEFWRQVRPETMRSTFRGIILLGIQGVDYAKLFDVKNECGLLEDLLTNHNMAKADAFHVMEAHSATVDYLLTRDRKLISKANRVAWLKPKLMTPLEFVKIYETEQNLRQS